MGRNAATRPTRRLGTETTSAIIRGPTLAPPNPPHARRHRNATTFPTINPTPSSVKIQKEKSLQHRNCEHFSLHDLIAIGQCKPNAGLQEDHLPCLGKQLVRKDRHPAAITNKSMMYETKTYPARPSTPTLPPHDRTNAGRQAFLGFVVHWDGRTCLSSFTTV
jgi:hypothetical protein